MRPGRIIFCALVLLMALVFWRATQQRRIAYPPVAKELTPAPPEPPPVSLAPSIPPDPLTTPETRAADGRDLVNPLVDAHPTGSPPPRRASDAEPEAAADFDQLVLMFRSYRDIAGGNPVGTNAEIMKAIMGDNPKGARVGPPDGQGLNPDGELLDRWGTPYFFHQLTKDLMEIRSAGPDRRMWNGDDLISD